MVLDAQALGILAITPIRVRPMVAAGGGSLQFTRAFLRTWCRADQLIAKGFRRQLRCCQAPPTWFAHSRTEAKRVFTAAHQWCCGSWSTR